jgi:hypothetical protein
MPRDAVVVARLRAFAHGLVNPAAARVAVAPERPEKGYWFGGGKMVQGPDGRLWLTGRYRSSGDSRTGLDLGDRGRELALFVSEDGGASWTKQLALDKAAVSADGEAALSIEGSTIRFVRGGVELYVSSEKRVPYPAAVAEFRKPGTGVWTIERLRAGNVAHLAQAKPETIVASADPATLQVKDPFLVERAGGGLLLFFCHHPFNWTSSGTGFVEIGPEGKAIGAPRFDCYPRGPAWDVAITRGTCILPVPERIAPAGTGLVFYDGGECLRNHEEHAQATRRPRGYSCEELGGLGWYRDADPRSFRRISLLFPEFASPDGTGCIRYVDVLATGDAYLATWQQSRPDGSQALMINRVGRDEALSRAAAASPEPVLDC